ncbi:MAG: hypothetical protein ACTSUC_09590 [Promethearchaeota archaeon]
MNKKKKKIRVWGKIKLYETSVVGIPSYPDAHLSLNPDSFSLVKALSNADLKPRFVEEGEEMEASHLTGDQLNMEEEKTMSEEEGTQTAQVEVSEKPNEEVSEKVSEEVSEKVSEEVSEKVSVEESEKEAEKSISKIIAEAIKKGFQEGIKELETERGLVSKEEKTEKSLGQLAIEHGLFTDNLQVR